MSAAAAEPLAPGFLAELGLGTAEARARGCSQPVRLRGSTMLVDTSTGEATAVYSSDRELDGYTYVRCGNRRASVCPSCSHEYKGDAWHLLVCGLAGGRGIAVEVAERPCTFATLTAPSFASSRAPGQGTVPGTPRQADLPARTAAVVQHPS